MTRSFYLVALLLGCVSALAGAQQSQEQTQEWTAPWDAPPAYEPPHAIIRMDVVAVDQAGKPVAGLGAKDFAVLDNGQPEKLQSFEAFDGRGPDPDPLVEVVLVIDALNLNSQQAEHAETELAAFLRAKGAGLMHPVSIYRLSSEGLSASEQPSIDGNALAEELTREREPRQVAIRDVAPRTQWKVAYAEMRNDLSLSALGAITIEQRRRPGRKVLFWIGPGWPVQGRAINSFDWVTELATRMREARIALYCVTELPSLNAGLVAKGFPRGVRSEGETRPESLALDVLALQSSGRVLQATHDLAGIIGKSLDEEGIYYRLGFDPPHANGTDEYHELKVQMTQQGLSVRARTGYYNEPVFYDQPEVAAQSLTVSQLEEWLDKARGGKDGETAERLSALALTERMSSARLAFWKAQMPGDKSRAALVALADDAAFLDPPAEKIPADATPDIETQKAMLARVIDYLNETVPRLPDFFARRTTHSYGEPTKKDDETWKTATGNRALQPENTSVATVLYRNGSEQVDAEKLKVKLHKDEDSMSTKGIFGPILSTVLLDAARSELTWSRWGEGQEGKRAVFRFVVPKEKSNYAVSFCCLTDMDAASGFEQFTGYHGEMTIDPASGAILRLAVQADLMPRSPLMRADILVEYGPVAIGGQTYVCPLRSVAITRKRTVMALHEWGETLRVFGPFITLLSDTAFDDYHKFGSESRILPGFTSVE